MPSTRRDSARRRGECGERGTSLMANPDHWCGRGRYAQPVRRRGRPGPPRMAVTGCSSFALNKCALTPWVSVRVQAVINEHGFVLDFQVLHDGPVVSSPCRRIRDACGTRFQSIPPTVEPASHRTCSTMPACRQTGHAEMRVCDDRSLAGGGGVFGDGQDGCTGGRTTRGKYKVARALEVQVAAGHLQAGARASRQATSTK